MNTDIPEYDEDGLRREVEILQQNGMSLAAMAREAGIKYGSFTNWFGSTYGGNTQKIAGQVSQWLAARLEQAEMVARVRVAPDFVETPTAQNIIAHVTYAHAAPDITMIAGVPGVGKTRALEEYTRTHPNVFMITARESVKSTSALLDELAFAVDVTERRGNRLNRAIGTALKDRKALIIVDEAQEATVEALDEIRTFCDLWNCGIVFAGDTRLFAKINGKGREGPMAQLSSRIWAPIKLPRPRPDDVSAIAAAWGILDPKIMKLVQKIGTREGGLRELTKVLKLASLDAANDGGDGTLTEAVIARAYQQKELSFSNEVRS